MIERSHLGSVAFERKPIWSWEDKFYLWSALSLSLFLSSVIHDVRIIANFHEISARHSSLRLSFGFMRLACLYKIVRPFCATSQSYASSFLRNNLASSFTLVEKKREKEKKKKKGKKIIQFNARSRLYDLTHLH